jgi:hypothetical protein
VLYRARFGEGRLVLRGAGLVELHSYEQRESAVLASFASLAGFQPWCRPCVYGRLFLLCRWRPSLRLPPFSRGGKAEPPLMIAQEMGRERKEEMVVGEAGPWAQRTAGSRGGASGFHYESYAVGSERTFTRQ